jgi:pseudaminic acid synthase
MKITIDNTNIGTQEPPYIIAELSANHNGSLEKAFQTIKAAKQCGANAVKLQTYTADTMTIDSDFPEFFIKGGLWDGAKLYDLYKDAQTPYEWHKPLFDYAKELDITIFSTPFDESAVDLLESLNSPAYKIASFELVDLPLIKYVAQTGKPMIMSTGMASKIEIEEAVDAARSSGCNSLVLLHCISSYPAPMDQANLKQLIDLSNDFNTLSGLSDHTLGTTASIAAVALGACVIEKHFILSRRDEGPDSTFSIEPHELEKLCSQSHNAWLATGKAGYDRQAAEQDMKLFRRSVYFVNNLKAGDIVTKDDIRRIRPGSGLSPKHFNSLLGKKLKVNVSRGSATSWDQFND